MEEKRKIFYERLGLGESVSFLSRRRRDVLLDKKWKMFLHYGRFFRHIPFIYFAFAAGSMALGNVRPSSDFDVILGARYGRVFTARFFCILFFGLIGARKKKFTHHDEAADKICLNHFITERSLCLRPPYNMYWQELYRNLVPLYGEKAAFTAFWEANAWMGSIPRAMHDDRRYLGEDRSLLKRFLEFALRGNLGERVERFLRYVQLRRIRENVKDGFGFEPRVYYSDEELEFHPDTARINSFLEHAERDA